MKNYLIDSHCHLHDQEWFSPEQATEYLQNAFASGVAQVIVIGTDPGDSEKACEFAASHENVYWTYGIHPEYTSHCPIVTVDQAQLEARPIAIGEIGLDYHYDGYDRTAQIRLFEQMLQLAQDLDLPVSLHLREAFADAWAVLANFPKTRGVIHSFTGSKKELRTALKRGFYIGVNGLATYTTPPLPPLECILLETDAPFLTPKPYRDTIRTNQPAYVKAVAAYLAEKMGVAEEKIAEQTTQNVRSIFQVGDPIFRSSADV